MPRLTRKLPSYRLHRASGQAIVTIAGRDLYLGRYNSPESRDAYDRAIAEWVGGGRAAVPSVARPGGGAPTQAGLTINELLVSYWAFAQTYYVKNGVPTGEQEPIRQSMKPLAKLYGRSPTAEFGPSALKAVRQAMVEKDLCRNVINARVNRIRRIFKWGVENEMVNPTVLHALQAVAPLKQGRCEVRESKAVKPVPDAVVDAVLPFAPSPVRALIELQRLTGMRPGEVVIMRGRDLDTTGAIWTYLPSSHKTEHHGRSRPISLGPKAQELIRPFLKPDLSAFLFSPREAVEERNRLRRQNRRTPMTPSQSMRRPKGRPKKQPGECYTTSALGHAIRFACDAAFPPPQGLDAKQVKQWRKDHRFHPNQLRHSAATYLRKRYGLEAARVILGHSSSAVTEIYAELDQAKSAEIMGQVG